MSRAKAAGFESSDGGTRPNRACAMPATLVRGQKNRGDASATTIGCLRLPNFVTLSKNQNKDASATAEEVSSGQWSVSSGQWAVGRMAHAGRKDQAILLRNLIRVDPCHPWFPKRLATSIRGLSSVAWKSQSKWRRTRRLILWYNVAI